MEITTIYTALSDMDDFARMADVDPIGPHKVLTDAIAELETLRQRVAELEKERDEALRVTFDPAVLEEMNKLTAERNELLAAAEAIEIDAEECLDFDECTAMLVPLDSYHKLIEAIASVKGET